MRKLKKLGIGLCMGAIAAAMMATPVCAKGSDEYDTENYHYNDYYDYYAGEDAYEYDLPSYTQPAPYGANFVYFSDDKKEDYRLTNEICEQCRASVYGVFFQIRNVQAVYQGQYGFQCGSEYY